MDITSGRRSILAVIPARYASVRFPGKPLAKIAGKPMIQWVYEAAQSCAAFTDVVVATDDERIANVVELFNGRVAMTSPDHQTGTDRVAEVAKSYGDVDCVANIQGDQPFVTGSILESLVEPYLCGDSPEMATIACPFSDDDAFRSQHAVKVICDQGGHAIYFSRSPIPYYRLQNDAPVYHHLGLYAFRPDFLESYASLRPTPLETCEQLEQLRVIEHGHKIRVSLVAAPITEVNTPVDLELANRIMHERNAKVGVHA